MYSGRTLVAKVEQQRQRERKWWLELEPGKMYSIAGERKERMLVIVGSHAK
jgi:hypothetical protein